jgi:hypothetical protein
MNEDQQQTSHKWHAIECNNLTWTLTEQESRTAEEDATMLAAAYAAAFHWDKVGTDLNRARAQLLVAQVHCCLGHGELAIAAVHESREVLLKTEMPDWEAATLEAIHAHAHFVAGEMQFYTPTYAEAQKLGAAIASDEDRAIFEATFRTVPKA